MSDTKDPILTTTYTSTNAGECQGTELCNRESARVKEMDRYLRMAHVALQRS